MNCNSNTMPLIDTNSNSVSSCSGSCSSRNIRVVCRNIIIPSGQNVLGVKDDMNSIKRTFILPTVNESGISLEEKEYVIITINANNEEYRHVLEEKDVEVSGNSIKLTWEPTIYEMAVQGNLQVRIEVLGEDFKWSTYPEDFVVFEVLKGDNIAVPEYSEYYNKDEVDGKINTVETQIHSINREINVINDDITNLNDIKADRTEIPTKTSELMNDSDFVVDSLYVHTDNNFTNEEKTKLSLLENYNDVEIKTVLNNKVDKELGKSLVSDLEIERLANVTNYNDTDIKTEIGSLLDTVDEHDKDLTNLDNELVATKQELEEQEQNINHLDDKKADKETTYTKEQVDELISAIENVRIEVVDDLPEIGRTNVIYFVRKQQEEFDDVFYEYVWESNQYELIGNTQIDLSDYITTGTLIGHLNSFYNKTYIDENLYTKQHIDANNYTKEESDAKYEPKLANGVDYSYQQVTYGNKESGYRKYKNGMLEQWGVATTQANETEFTMHQAHINQNFSIFIEPREQGNFFHYAIPSGNQKFKCRIQTRDSVSAAIKFQWRSWGYWK